MNTKHSTMPKNSRQILDLLIGRNQYTSRHFNKENDSRSGLALDNYDFQAINVSLNFSDNIIEKNSKLAIPTKNVHERSRPIACFKEELLKLP
jgi:hypothetical protein